MRAKDNHQGQPKTATKTFDGDNDDEEDEWVCVLSKAMRRRLKASGRTSPLSIRLPSSSTSGHRPIASRTLLSFPDDSLSSLKIKFSSALGHYPARSGSLVMEVLTKVKERVNCGRQTHNHDHEKAANILCLGLGNPAVDASSLRQLAFLAALVEASGGFFLPGKTFVYDPVLKATSREFIRRQGFRVLSKNREGAYSLPSTEFTLVFLPHCPLALADGVVASNWDSATLNHLVFLTCPLKPRLGGDPVPHLASLQPHRRTDSFAKDGERDFEGLRIEWFEVSQLPLVVKATMRQPHCVRAGGDLLTSEDIASFIDSSDNQTTAGLV